MPRIVAGALNRDVLRAWAALVLVLWLALFAARFSVYLGEAVGGRLPGDLVFKLTLLKSVGFFVFVMPLALYLGLLLVLDHRRRTFESVALAASGFGPLDHVRSLAVSILLITLLNALLVLFVVPGTVDAGYRMKGEAAAAYVAHRWMPGRFISLRDGALLLYAETAGAGDGTLSGVFARLRERDGAAWLTAARATLATGADGRHTLRFEDGHRYRGEPGRADFRRLDFARLSFDLDAGDAGAPLRWDAVSTPRLVQATDADARAHWQTRLSRPVSTLVLALCAVWLAARGAGGGRRGLLTLGLVVFAVYFLLLGVAHDLVASGRLPPFPGLWWVHAVPPALVAAASAIPWSGRRT